MHYDLFEKIISITNIWDDLWIFNSIIAESNRQII